MTTDEMYMKRCIDLAQKASGKTYPNPLVGCVIVHYDKIIGEGYHEKAGSPHAEINAINSVKDPSLLIDSTLYVSLEPCAHFGKTPPCANKLIEVGFKKVVIGTLDSHEKVNGKGKQILESAGIEVVTGILENECRLLNKRFFTFHQKKRPYIILKWAESADGFIDKNYKPSQIGNPLTKQFVHTLRSEEHAILVGTNTALKDNPSLTVREIEGQNPVRILVDFGLKVPHTFNILNNEAHTIIFNQIKDSAQNNLTYIKISKENFLRDMISRFYSHQIQSIIVEGGRFMLQQFIDENLWDKAVIIKNPDLFLENGTQAPGISAEPHEIKNFRDNTIEFYIN